MIRSAIHTGLDLGQLWRITRARNRHGIRILMYHGVTDHPVPNWTQVSSDEFDQHMRYLRKDYTPISLHEAEEMLEGARPVVAHPVVVTFDDGFGNNVTHAYPILRKYNIPATIFVTTSFLDRDSRFAGLIWTDFVYALLDGSPARDVDLTDLGLSRYAIATPQQRYQVKGMICHELKRFDYQEKNKFLEALRRRLHDSIRPDMYDIFGPMSWQDLRQLADDPLISVGAHTVNHEILSRVPVSVMEQEVVGSQERLEHCLGKPIRHFAYPNGTLEDFTEQASELVRQRFSSAVTTLHGLNDRSADKYLLRRIAVGRGTSLKEFKLGLSGILDVLYALRGGRSAGQTY